MKLQSVGPAIVLRDLFELACLQDVENAAEGFASDRVEAEEIVDAGDRVVVMVHHSGRGRTSGIEVDQRYAMVWTVRDGRVMRMDLYPTRAEALEAVGLAE